MLQSFCAKYVKLKQLKGEMFSAGTNFRLRCCEEQIIRILNYVCGAWPRENEK
jgi:hypothetical protein